MSIFYSWKESPCESAELFVGFFLQDWLTPMSWSWLDDYLSIQIFYSIYYVAQEVRKQCRLNCSCFVEYIWEQGREIHSKNAVNCSNKNLLDFPDPDTLPRQTDTLYLNHNEVNWFCRWNCAILFYIKFCRHRNHLLLRFPDPFARKFHRGRALFEAGPDEFIFKW